MVRDGSSVCHAPSSPTCEIDLMDKRTLLIAQVFITLMMAGLMSGIMGLIVLGPSAEWLHAWPRQFITAWPIAFGLTFVVSPIAFGLAIRIRRLGAGR
jgi:hypothetical protein